MIGRLSVDKQTGIKRLLSEGWNKHLGRSITAHNNLMEKYVYIDTFTCIYNYVQACVQTFTYTPTRMQTYSPCVFNAAGGYDGSCCRGKEEIQEECALDRQWRNQLRLYQWKY